jgi:hypothetical protein
MAKVVKIGFLILVIALTANLLISHRMVIRAAMRSNKGFVPYTVRLRAATTHNGVEVPGLEEMIAYRADGSRVIELVDTRENTNIEHPLSERIVNFSSRKQTFLMDNRNQKSTSMITNDLRQPNPRNNCLTLAGEQAVSEEVVDGYNTVKATLGGVTSWYALDYGCALIKDHAEFPNGTIENKHLVSLTVGEPAASLFAEPDYEELPPSKIFSHAGKEPTQELLTEDQFYFANRPK